MRQGLGGLTFGAMALAACNALTGADGFVAVEGRAPDGGGPPPDVDASGEPIPEAGAADGFGPSGADGGGDADAALAKPDAEAGPCIPVSVGPRYAQTTTGGDAWSGRNGIRVPNDGLYAHSNGDNPTGLTVQELGFALPASARVVGIKVEIDRTAVGAVSDQAITLPKGTSKANGAWPQGELAGPYTRATYGGATDTWGETWTATDVNATTFGVTVTVSGAGDGHADAVGVTVTYCP